MSRFIRPLGVVAASLLLMGNICNRGEEEAAPTPTPEPRLEPAGGFELVARVTGITLGGQELDLPELFPESAPEGITAPQAGNARMAIEDLSDLLAEECGLDRDDSVRVHWTEETGFDSPDLPESFDEEGSFEEAFLEEVVAVVGVIFRERETAFDDIPGLLPETMPDEECILVADQVFLVQEGSPLPAARPRRAAASPTATPTPPTPTPTRSPRPPTNTAQ